MPILLTEYHSLVDELKHGKPDAVTSLRLNSRALKTLRNIADKWNLNITNVIQLSLISYINNAIKCPQCNFPLHGNNTLQLTPGQTYQFKCPNCDFKFEKKI
jgi:tRNA(Ile2) C34 agmatinyltransferase TiaS